MDFTSNHQDHREEISALFASSFTDSEGEDEGQLIAKLVTDIFATTPEDDLFVFSALDQGNIRACIIFTRMGYAEDNRTVFLLSPVVVATALQGKGVGQGLLHHGLNHLKDHGVDVVLTYGDINFYSKVGFQQITEADAAAPMSLSYPNGWLGQSLSGPSFDPLSGPSTCVAAFHKPELW